MALDLWTHQFCLACDRQVQSDGAAYCSESCRLADFEKSPSPGSEPGSPGSTTSSCSWSTTPAFGNKPTRTRFYLSPAYDFSNAQPYGPTAVKQPSTNELTFCSSLPTASGPASTRTLSPSSSHSSLCSMQSSTSSLESSQVSATARKELQAYAISFDHVRLQRRRSY